MVQTYCHRPFVDIHLAMVLFRDKSNEDHTLGLDVGSEVLLFFPKGFMSKFLEKL
jgi:hypothetical protein